MFVDASVLVALLAGEAEADLFATKLAAAKVRYTSAVAVLEAVARLAVLLDVDPLVVEESLQALLDTADLSVVPVSGGVGRKAVAAFAAYGRGTAHPARLSLPACLSHACAEAYRVPLLSKDVDFTGTGVRVA